MFASIPAIMSTVAAVASTVKVLFALGRDVAPALADLKKLVSGDKITVADLAEIRARNDALNAEIEAQTEDGA